jgi:TIR domain
MADVFISYAHRNAERVAPIADRLSHDGYSLWWDPHMRAGDDFGPRIEKELHAARCVVVAWSKVARDSLWVRAEATEALEAGKLVQVVLDRAKPPIPFTMVHFADLSRWGGDPASPAWTQLEAGVRAVAREGVSTRLQEPHESRPVSAVLGPVIAVGGGSLGLVALTSALTGMATSGSFHEGAFGAAVTSLFVLACLALGHMCTRVIQVALASRRS